MKKILFALAVLGGTALSSIAQTASTSSSPKTEGGKFSIGLEGGLPVGDVSNGFNAVVGGSLKYEFPTATNTYFTISGGYSAFLTKAVLKNLGAQSSVGFVPLKAGIKGYVSDGVFLEGQLGVVFSTENNGGHAFVYSPGLGYTFSGGFEAGVRYEGWANNGTVSQVALRLAYRL
jgi:hypothetical protein